MSKKKILFIHHAAGWGGAPKSMIELIKSLDKSKFQVQVLLLKNSIVSEKLAENDIKYYLPESFFYKKVYYYFTHSEAGYVKWYQVFRILKLGLIWFLSRFYFAAKELKRFDYDVVHLNSSVLTDWLAPAKKNGKVIIHIREPFRKGQFDLLHKFFRRQMKMYADKIIAISRDNSRRVNLPEKTSIIYNSAKIPELPSPEHSYASKKFLYLGGDAYIKGFYTLVSALDFLEEGIKIIFAGHYSKKFDEKRFKSVIKRLLGFDRKKRLAMQKMKNHKSAIEIGLIYNTDEYYRECSCLISPFAVPHFSRPVIEAFLHKKPVIVSDVAGMEEIVTHNVNGLVFKAGDPIDLAKAINFLAANPDLAKKMGENGYKIAVEKFTDSNVQIIESIYDNLLTQ